MALLVLVLSTIFDPNEDEKIAIHHIKFTKTAAKTILNSMRFFVAKKKAQMLKLKKK